MVGLVWSVKKDFLRKEEVCVHLLHAGGSVEAGHLKVAKLLLADTRVDVHHALQQ